MPFIYPPKSFKPYTMYHVVPLMLSNELAYHFACELYGILFMSDDEAYKEVLDENIQELEKLFTDEDHKNFKLMTEWAKDQGREQLMRLEGDILKVPAESIKHFQKTKT